MTSLQSVTGIALVLHELATNAAKYGALGHPDGKLIVSWTASDLLRLEWSERGSPAPAEPSNTGVGGNLIRARSKDSQGTLKNGWDPNGLDIVIRISIRAL